jgi:hypothetical protein
MEANAKNCKVYVKVQTDIDEDGRMFPRRITWEDGRSFDIDRVGAVRPAYAAKAGGQGDRYTIYVNGLQRYLFFERSANINGNVIGRWFLERR